MSPLAALSGDPTVRLVPGRFERATVTPDGDAAIIVTWEPGGVEAEVVTVGDGAGWLAGRASPLLGCHDDVTGFTPESGSLAQLWRRFRGDRIGATGTLWHDAAWFIVQQRVRRQDASEQWRRLVTALGKPVPGTSLLTPPDPSELGRLAYQDLHRFGIERRRAEHLLHASWVADRLHTLVDTEVGLAMPQLRSIRGIGPWTTTCLATQTWGAADTVVVGDAGIPSRVAWLLAGERRADDARMLELLEPYRPHRYRVVRLAFLGGVQPPRRRPGRPGNDIRFR